MHEAAKTQKRSKRFNDMKTTTVLKPTNPFSPINWLAVRFVAEWRGGKRVERVVYDPTRKGFFVMRMQADGMFGAPRQVTVSQAFRWWVTHQDEAQRLGGFNELTERAADLLEAK